MMPQHAWQVAHRYLRLSGEEVVIYERPVKRGRQYLVKVVIDGIDENPPQICDEPFGWAEAWEAEDHRHLGKNVL